MKHELIALFLIATAAYADDPQFSGFVDIQFAWNDNRPANHENFFPGAGTTAKRANEFAVNLAQVQWSRAVSAEQPVGFTLALVAGEGADVVHGGDDTFRHLYQASVAYRFSDALAIEGGVYPSHIGMEGFYTKDNWNYTRSIMGEASPYFQTGVKATYAFNDHWSGRVDLLNGWQNIRDDDDNKSIGTQVAYTDASLTAAFNTFIDVERKFADVVIVYRANPRFQLGAAIDIGTENDADWYGAVAYARYAINEHAAIAFRAEHFSDPDNGITGFAQTINEGTLTFELRPHDNLILKLEGRYDKSDAGVFFRKDATTDSQFLALAGVVVTF
ncbi:MAG TPA: porin [Thermoanaerobaculia bacterium]|nr:porin [Thermoanaerobaculia bacterium]